MRKLAKKQTGGSTKVKKSSYDSAFKAASNKIEKARAIGDSLAKKSVLKKAQVGVATTPAPVKPIAPISPRMQKAVSDSTAGAQYLANARAKLTPEEQQYSNIKPKMEAAVRATKRPASVRSYEKERAVQSARSAASDAANKAKYQKEFAGRFTSSAKPTVTVRKTGGATKMQKGGASVDSSAYFSKKFDNAYESLKSGKVSKKQGLSDMKKATEGSNRQLVKRGLKK